MCTSTNILLLQQKAIRAYGTDGFLLEAINQGYLKENQHDSRKRERERERERVSRPRRNEFKTLTNLIISLPPAACSTLRLVVCWNSTTMHPFCQKGTV